MKRSMDWRGRRAFTLLEVVIASALTGVLVMLALGAVFSVSQPVTVVTNQADLTNRGSAAMRLLVSELESSAELTVLTLPGGGAAVESGLAKYGRKVTYKKIVDYTTAPVYAQGGALFELWFERVGANEFALRRKVIQDDGTALTVTVLEGIRCQTDEDGVLDGTTPVDPYFQLTGETRLTIHFRLRRQVGNDGSEPVFTEVEFKRDVNVRNNIG